MPEPDRGRRGGKGREGTNGERRDPDQRQVGKSKEEERGIPILSLEKSIHLGVRKKAAVNLWKATRRSMKTLGSALFGD